MKIQKTSIVAIGLSSILGIGMGFLAAKKDVLSKVNLQAQSAETSENIVPGNYQGKLKLFVLAGQSNMSGMAEMPKAGVSTNPRIYVFGNDYHWKLAQEPVDDPTGQVDRVSADKSAGYGPSMAFATTLLKQNPDMVIGLIPCAKGGSSIHDWRRNLSDSTLYGSCLKRVRAASVMGTVAGFLFFQGEIDTVDPKEQPERTFLPNQWADKFTTLLNDWRNDLNQPDLPVIYAQIGTNTEPRRFVNWNIVKEQQRRVQLPFSRMITTDDLALMDYVHFTTESYQTIGQRFGEAYLELLNSQRSSKMRSLM